jgi:flagellar basal body-associated protein FliL
MLNSVTKRRNSVPLDDDDVDIAEHDRDDTDAVDPDSVEVEDTKKQPKAGKERRRVSISIRGLAIGVIVVLLTAATAAMTWLYLGAEDKLDAQAAQASNDKRAEQIALDYSVNAAIMDYQDLGPWKASLVKGTSPDLTTKLAKAGTAMEQILTPLQWVSTAKPLTAKVRSDTDGVYVVDAFVGVMTKTAQAPDSLQSTATYSLTIDSSHDWQITDVGGIGGVTGDK